MSFKFSLHYLVENDHALIDHVPDTLKTNYLKSYVPVENSKAAMEQDSRPAASIKKTFWVRYFDVENFTVR